MTEAEIREACKKLMESAPTAYLTVIDGDGYPRTRAMLNLRNCEMYAAQAHLYKEHQDDFMIYITTNTSSRKRQDIETNPRVGVYYCNPDAFHGVLLLGDVEIVDDLSTKEALWAEGWKRYYTTGRPDDPDYTVLRLFPRLVNGWYERRKFEFHLGGG